MISLMILKTKLYYRNERISLRKNIHDPTMAKKTPPFKPFQKGQSCRQL